MKMTSPLTLIGEHAHQVRRLSPRTGPRRELEVHAHLPRDQRGQGGLAEPRRAVEEQVVQWFPALLGRLDRDAQRLADLILADELLEALRPERGLGHGIFLKKPPVVVISLLPVMAWFLIARLSSSCRSRSFFVSFGHPRPLALFAPRPGPPTHPSSALRQSAADQLVCARCLAVR